MTSQTTDNQMVECVWEVEVVPEVVPEVVLRIVKRHDDESKVCIT